MTTTYRTSLHAVLKANSLSVATFTLVEFLVKLGGQKGIYIHQHDVYEYVDRAMEKKFQAYPELFTVDEYRS